MIFKLITINYSYSTLQIQNFKLHFISLNCPQYSRFLKLRQLFQKGGGEGGGSRRQGISISLSMPTYLRASAWLYLKRHEKGVSRRPAQVSVHPGRPASGRERAPRLRPPARSWGTGSRLAETWTGPFAQPFPGFLPSGPDTLLWKAADVARTMTPAATHGEAVTLPCRRGASPAPGGVVSSSPAIVRQVP